MFMTPDEAEGLNVFFAVEPPESIKCDYCGDELKPIGRRAMMRREIIAWNKFEECQCEGAAEARRKAWEEEENRKVEEEIALTRAEHQAQIEKLFKQSKLGVRFKNRTFENFRILDDNKTVFETAQKYAMEFEKYKAEGVGLNFNGTFGAGKTHLAAAIANYLINNGIPVIFGTVINLLGKLKESYNNDGSEAEILGLYGTVDLLILDDLGKERVNEWVLEKLYHIINERYENNLPLVITTNYDIDDLTQRFTTKSNEETAKAITSRLWEMCRGQEMNFEDFRKR
jgi:DNA replication protein DnaC